MLSIAKSLVAACIFLMLAGSASMNAAARCFLEGHLKIVLLKEVELSGEDSSTATPKTDARTYAEYPLVIRNRDGKKEITRIIADGDGNYRTALPPGDYVLDVQGRTLKRVRAKPQPFTVVSNRTVRVDMDLDTGIR